MRRLRFEPPPAKIALAIFLAVAALQIPADLAIGEISAAWGVLIDEALFIFATPALILALCGYSPLAALESSHPGARKLIASISFMIGAAVIIGYAGAATNSWTMISRDAIDRAATPMIAHSWDDFYLKLLLLCAVAPACEEMLFRGIIQRSLARRFGGTRAMLLTAIFFACIHATSFEPHLYLLLGLSLSWIYMETGSLRIAIACHAINNAWAMMNNMHGFGFPLSRVWGPLDAAFIACAVAIAIASVVWMRMMRAHVDERRGPVFADE